MTPQEALERLLPAYSRYYDVVPEAPAPFDAAAEFHSHGESYILVKSAKLWEMDSNEYVYFAAGEAFSAEKLTQYIETAWALTMPRVTPGENHRSSDVTVIFLTPALESDARRVVRRTARSKSYRHGLQGWSNLRLGAYEYSTGRITCNRHGRDLKKIISKNFQTKKIGE
ncbi:MAG: hypothetical protein IJL08_02155 [Oscillospiraceae bacterium]|jgi:hypothetical protein|nr:hypothetical protein [Oscillospiraceae bacterium]